MDTSNNNLDLFKMANLSTNKTGLKYIIWVSSKNANCPAMIKVSKKKNNFICSITVNEQKIIGNCNIKPKEINKIKEWIVMNKELLLKLWEFEITFDEFVDKIVKKQQV